MAGAGQKECSEELHPGERQETGERGTGGDMAAGESKDGIISFRGMLRQQRIRTIESREKVSGAGVRWLPFLFTKDYFLRHIVAYNGFLAYREPTETIWIIYYRLLNFVEIFDYILFVGTMVQIFNRLILK